jgi:hypothetical protein
MKGCCIVMFRKGHCLQEALTRSDVQQPTSANIISAVHRYDDDHDTSRTKVLSTPQKRS